MTLRPDSEPFDEKRVMEMIIKLQEEIKDLQLENDELRKYIQEKVGDKEESARTVEEPANKKVTENASKYQLEKYMLDKFHQDKTLPLFKNDFSRHSVRILLVEKIKCQLNEIKGQFAGNVDAISTVDQITNLLDQLPKKTPKDKAKKKEEL